MLPSLLAAQGLSEEEYHKNIAIMQKRPFVEARRFELSLGAASNLNPGMYYHWGPSAQAWWHFNNEWFAGLEYTQWFSQETSLRHELEDDFELLTDRAELAYQGLARVGWVPIMGKASLFGGGPVYFDFFVAGGGGVTGTRLSQTAPTVNLGAGSRMFLGSALALVLEVADSAYMEDFLAGSSPVHNVKATLGLSIFFPFSVEGRYGK